jgi:large subunit ribosomal protein L18
MSTQSIRKKRTTKKITYSYPVLTVSRSNKNILAQVISPETKNVIFTTSSNKLNNLSKTNQSISVGEDIAKWLKGQNILQIVFNRNGYVYHGRIKALAETVRNNGITI